MLINEIHIECLNKALSKLLGKESAGTIAFIRCLPKEIIGQLNGQFKISVPEWETYIINKFDDPSNNIISADRAVELRELKNDRLLFIVGRNAGAGMDGIFSSSREILETELFREAGKIAVKSLGKEHRDFAKKAIKVSKKTGIRNTISPLREFDFYANSSSEPAKIGYFVILLGLWPIETTKGLSEVDLGNSSLLTAKLLPAISVTKSIPGRINSILLPPDSQEQKAELERFLRENDSEQRLIALSKLENYPELFLNKLNPGIFDSDIQDIEITPWRKSKGKPLTWSGLKKEEKGDSLQLVVDMENNKDSKKSKKSKLQVRWTSKPQNLIAGSVEYLISIISGADNELVQKNITHTGKKNESCTFTKDDFEELHELDPDGKWEAIIRIEAIIRTNDAANPEIYKETESFILTFGQVDDTEVKSSTGKITNSFSDELINLSEEEFIEACDKKCEEDKQGYIKINGVNARVFRPGLIKTIEEDWQSRQYSMGRWVVKVREDGTLLAPPEFIELDYYFEEDDDIKDRLWETSKKIGGKADNRCGFMGIVYRKDDSEVIDYINLWTKAIEKYSSFALANTIEIRTHSNNTVGIIILPSHPLRVAWHNAYDTLAYYARYKEQLKPKEVQQILSAIDGSYSPAFLPGLMEKTSFIFGDTLGFHAIAMIPDTEKEPQAAIALMARTLSPGIDDIAPSVSKSTACSIAREIERYAKIHDEYHVLKINALRPGDSHTITRALHEAVRMNNDGSEIDNENNNGTRAFILNLYPDSGIAQSPMLGRYLTELTEKRRSGVAANSEHRWIMETFPKNNVMLPKLRWAKRPSIKEIESAHLTVAFDTFDSTVVAFPEAEYSNTKPYEAFGLFPSLLRTFDFNPIATWYATVSPNSEGEKHPLSGELTERLAKVNSAILKATAINISKDKGSWPVLKTEINAEKAESLMRLHEQSDWVVTVDRNAGLEFFDAPRENPGVYDTYVIDCVPERQDLNIVQLVTSTIHVDEVLRLLDKAINDMGLSHSERNCNYLLPKLKAISGRLAMRLSNQHQNAGELIALAMFYSFCEEVENNSVWLPVQKGFFVPLDDVRDLLSLGYSGKKEKDSDMDEELSQESGKTRADLIYVDITEIGALQFTFVEIKYRRLLCSAKDPNLFSKIKDQTENSRINWNNAFFSDKLTKTQLAVRRKKLADTLDFYLKKANRHCLGDDAYGKLSDAVNRLYYLEKFEPEMVANRGYIFCPEFSSGPEEIDGDDTTAIYIFGPDGITPNYGQNNFTVLEVEKPDSEHPIPADIINENNPETGNEKDVVEQPGDSKDSFFNQIVEKEHPTELESSIKELSKEPIQITLGNSKIKGTEINWNLSIKGNPHLMIVGLPGMGKTTCIHNLCMQLFKNGIVPIIFSYHDDIETKLEKSIGELKFVDVEMGIGFNPLNVIHKNAYAWLDQTGMLRDIFSAIYPDFGDIQNDEIRKAIRQSYVELGYDRNLTPMESLEVPKFQRFYDILKGKPKPNPGIIARLGELNDYSFFRAVGNTSTLLDGNKPIIIRLYRNQNMALQNAMASFLLLNIYQNMFIRGEQNRITHAVIFDEAHRASKLKLLPTMAKECRKYGISLIVASQAAKDFDSPLYSAIANYLVLRVVEGDAKALAHNMPHSKNASKVAEEMKQLPKYSGLFFGVEKAYKHINLTNI